VPVSIDELTAAAPLAAIGAVHQTPSWMWPTFIGTILLLLVVDLTVLHPRASVMSSRRAVIEACGWVGVGLAFGALVWASMGSVAGGEYIAGYVTEKSLSVDNVFVWAVILGHFVVPRALQHRALFWGIILALILRAGFIIAGVALLDRLSWLFYVFGAFLIFTAIRLARSDDDEIDPEAGRVIRVARRLIPSTPHFHGPDLFTRVDGKRVATPMLFVLLVIGATDVVFAVDSIPAILALSNDQFVVLSSNAFAVLGLRSLFFLFAELQTRFQYLEEGLAVILAFVGVKMILEHGIGGWQLHLPILVSLGVIVAVLVIAMVASVASPESGSPESGSRLSAEPGQRDPADPADRSGAPST